MRLMPFRALRPRADLADKVACVPYDVVDTEEARRLAANNPLSFLHVSRSEIDLPDGTDIHSEAVYAKASENFLALRRHGSLVREAARSLYVYELRSSHHTQRGVVGCCDIGDYLRNAIRRHEKTTLAKEEDRMRHIRRLRTSTGLVLMFHRDDPSVDAAVSAAARMQPLMHFTALDGVEHTVWRVERPGNLARCYHGLDGCYIADGHHRASAAVRIGVEMRENNARHTGREEYNGFPAALFPAGQMNILPYNRCVRDLNGLSPADFLERVGRVFALRDAAAPRPPAPKRISMLLGGKWYDLSCGDVEARDPVADLDVSLLQDRLLAPVLGIADPRACDRIEFVGGAKGPEELVRRVASGRAAVAFSMYPVTTGQIMAVSDRGGIMPPKSTWFEPKVWSGLLMHTF